VHEVTHLCIDDVELHKKAGSVRIRDQKTRAQRMVPLNASSRNALGRYLKTRGHVPANEPLFLSQQKKRMSPKNLKYLAKKYLCMAGRSDLSARDLRHNFARRRKIEIWLQIQLYRSVNKVARSDVPIQLQTFFLKPRLCNIRF
jgi:site-specific recombinase XerD